jgi:hypothetical protein
MSINFGRTIVHFRFPFLLLLISTIFSEEVTNALPQTGSIRAFAMGGTYIAYDAGINALFGNPAGLPASNNVEIIVGYDWQMYKNSQFNDQYYYRFTDSYSIKYKQNHRLNYLGLSYQQQFSNMPFKFAGAIGFSPFYNWHSTRCYKSDSRYVSGTSEIIESSTESEEKIVGLYDLMSFGIGFSQEAIWAIGVSWHYPIRKQFENERHSLYIYRINGNREISESKYENSVEVSACPFLRIGSVLSITSQVSLGILWMQAHRYSKANQSRVFPATLNFGISCRIVPELLCACDIQSRPWEKVKIKDEYIANAKSGNAYRFGMEYENIILIRAGYAWDLLPFTDADKNEVNFNDISIGIGYKFNRIVLDTGIRYRFAKYKVKISGIRENIYTYTIREIRLQSTIKIIL